MEGSVKWFNRTKGFGFIQGEDGNEYFVHNTALAKGTFIRDNDRVAFDPAETEKGKQAQNVTLLQKGSEIASQAESVPEESTEESASAESAPEESTEESASAESVPEESTEESASAESAPEESTEEKQQ